MSYTPQIDLEPWRTRIRPNSAGVGLLTGPEDLISLEHERAKLFQSFDPGPRIEVDVFVFSIGEPNQRRSTKLGGLPYLDSRSSWPLSRDGEPMHFIAQLDFSGSRDLLQVDIPSDTLLLFARWPVVDDELIIRWVDETDPQYLVQAHELPIDSPFAPMAGHRFRTNSYTEGEKRAVQEERYDILTVLRPFATQIGHGAYMLSIGDPAECDNDTFACVAPLALEGKNVAPLVNVEHEVGCDNHGWVEITPGNRVKLPTRLLAYDTDASLFVSRTPHDGFEVFCVNG